MGEIIAIICEIDQSEEIIHTSRYRIFQGFEFGENYFSRYGESHRRHLNERQKMW